MDAPTRDRIVGSPEATAAPESGSSAFRIIPRAVRAARGRRAPDIESENRALHSLAKCLTERPQVVLDRLLEIAMTICGGDTSSCTAGVSLVIKRFDGTEHFRWVAIAGALTSHVGTTTQRNSSPCGECLDLGEPIHFERPDLKYPHYAETGSEFSELLVVPFASKPGAPILGTLWIASHPPKPRLFDDEDERLLTLLAEFAANGYLILSERTPEQLPDDEVLAATAEHPRPVVRKNVRQVPAAAALPALFGASLVMLGWMIDSVALKSLFVTNVTVKPNSALGIIGCALALFVLSPRSNMKRGRFAAAAPFAGGAILIALLTAVEYAFGISTGIDRLLFASGISAAETIPRLRMSAVTAACLMLLGSGLLVAGARPRKYSWVADVAFVLTGSIALASILWYTYGAIPITGTGQGLQIAMPTAVMIFLLSIGGFFLRPQSRLLRTVLSGRAGGQLAVKLLPFVFIIPLTLGAVRSLGILGITNESVESSLVATLTMLAFAVVVWWSADELNSLDRERSDANQQRSELRLVAEREKLRAEAATRTQEAAEVAYDRLRDAGNRERTTDAFLSAALNSSPMGEAFWDTSLRLLRVNSVLAAWSGLPTSEFVGKTLHEIDPHVAEILQPVVEEVLTTAKPRINVEIIRPPTIPGDVTRRLNAVIYPVLGNNREVLGVGAAYHDISRDYERERALVESNERYAIVAKATNDAVWDMDCATRTTTWSESISVLFGYQAHDIDPNSRWWEGHIHPEERDEVVRSFQRALQGDSTQWQATYRFKKADDSYAYVVDRGYIIRDDEGRARRALGAISDRTMQSALEANLRHSLKMDAIGKLSSGVAHDFNNVLAVVSISAEYLLSEMKEDDPLYGEAVEIRKAAERGGRLTRQLLAFTRQQVLSPVALDVNSVLDEMMGMLQRLVPRDIAMKVNRGARLGLVHVDRGQLEQIIMNLVVNGFDAMTEGGELRIETATFTGTIPCSRAITGDFVTLSVADTGTGMDEETITRIFDPFFTTKDIGKGTGLGLATVHGIVKQSGGEVCVQSALGDGSVFTIYLPAIHGSVEHAPSAAAPAEGSAKPATTQTILLVEDDDALRSSVGKILRRAGYNVVQARNGAEALEAGATSGRIDLVLTDARMPVMGGAELFRRIKRDRINTAVLVMSGYTDEIEMGELQAHETAFLAKPFTSEALLRAVRIAISST